MSNVLSEEKRQQVIALGRLGWPLRQIQKATRIRRETASTYLKAAGIAVRPPGAWGRRAPAKPAISNNVGSVKHFFCTLLRALEEERHFALVEEFLPTSITKARL
jgi:hypothetical protein